MKHTKGPWKINKWERDNVVDGFETIITDRRGHGIVTFNKKGNNEKVIANAHLIASSPKLLEACEKLLRALEAHIDNECSEKNILNRDLLCPCNQNEIVFAKQVISEAKGNTEDIMKVYAINEIPD